MKKSLLALTLLAALPFAAQAADGLSYNYAQVGYTQFKSGDVKARGWSADGSIAVHPNVSIYAGTDQLNVRNSDLNADQWRLGVGFNKPINNTTDFVARAGYQRLSAGSNTDFGGLTISNGVHFNGYNVEGGVRSALTPQIEGYAMLGFEDYAERYGVNPGSTVYGRFGGQYKFNQNWGVQGDVKLASGDHIWSIGPRISW